MIITKEQMETLQKYVPEIEELVETDDVQEVLDSLDAVIINDILGNNDEPSEFGVILQLLYDEIYEQN